MQSSTTRLAYLLKTSTHSNSLGNISTGTVVFGSFWGPSPILLVSDLIHSGACNLAELTEERGRVEKEASSGFESSCPS